MIQRFQAFLTGITTCYKYIQRIKNAEMTEFGLKGIHVSCLFYLSHSAEGLTSAQLCQLCAEDKATISRIVADLREKGYMEPGEGKNYRATLHLTPAGIEIGKKMEPIIESWVGIGGVGLTDSERETFYEGLSLISENLRHKIEENG